MSNSDLSRFTPSLLAPELLEALLVQRHALAETIVDGIRASAFTSNRHYVLLVGPRGIGKTHLVSLVFHRVAKEPRLDDRLRIAWLREDEWGVASYLDLLRVIIRALFERYPLDEFRAAYDDFLRIRDARSAEGAAERLLRAATGSRTLLLIAENFDEIFSGIEQDGQHKLRAYIQTDPFLAILATAQGIFNAVSVRDEPFYGFFQTVHLRELSFAEALQLVTNISRLDVHRALAKVLNSPLGRARMRAVHHLAGGNPRVYVIFSQFLTSDSLDQLVQPLMRTLDDLTPYYQSRMASLSPQQRKIIEHLCDARGATPVKEIAQACFITPQTVSSQLNKLSELGFVRSTAAGRESHYELQEPLLRMTLEMKKVRGEPIALIVEFLRVWYSTNELSNRLTRTSNIPETDKHYLRAALQRSPDARAIDVASLCEAVRDSSQLVGDFGHAYEASEEVLAVRGTVDDLLQHAWLKAKRGLVKDAIEDYAAVLALPDVTVEQRSQAYSLRAVAKGTLGDTVGAIDDYLAVLSMPDAPPEQRADALFSLAYWKTKNGDGDGAIDDYSAMLALNVPAEQRAKALINRGYQKGQLGDNRGAIDDYSKVLGMEDSPAEQRAQALVNRGCRKGALGDGAGEVEDYTDVLAMPDAPPAQRGHALINRGISKLMRGDSIGAIDDFSAVLHMVDVPVEERAHALFSRGIAKSTLAEAVGEIDDYTALLEMQNVSAERRAGALLNRGIAKSTLGDSAGVIDDYTALINMREAPDEQRTQALVNRGVARSWLGDRAGAIDDYTAVLSIPRASVEQRAMAHSNIGVESLESGQLAHALSVFEDLAREYGETVNILANLAEVLVCFGRFDEAITYFSRARMLLRNTPDFDIDSNYGAVLMLSGNMSEGRALLRSAAQQYAGRVEEQSGRVAIVRNLLLRSKDSTEWRRMIAEFVPLFTEEKALSALGQGLVASIRTLRNADVTPAIALSWWETWQDMVGETKELDLPLRLLGAAARYIEQRDVRHLLALAIEERRLVEPLLGVQSDTRS